MSRLSKFKPVFRSIGVIGATAGLVSAVTFANLTSNTVALSPNSVTVASTALNIGDGACAGLAPGTRPGFNVSNFSVSNPATVNFCLSNTGEVPLLINGSVSAGDPGALNGNAAAQASTLTIQCGSDPAISGTLNTGWTTNFPTALTVSNQEVCSATLTLSPSYTGPSDSAIPSFDINFVGTEPTPA